MLQYLASTSLRIRKLQAWLNGDIKNKAVLLKTYLKQLKTEGNLLERI